MLESLESVSVLYSLEGHLTRRLKSRDTLREFQEARRRQLVLAQFLWPLDVVEFLHSADPRKENERSAVTAVLIKEAQSRRHPGWNALLLLSFLPHLCRIRGWLGRVDGVSTRELEMRMLDGFLTAVAKFPLPTQGKLAVFNLAANARKNIIQLVQREQTWRRMIDPIPEDEDCCPILADNSPSPEELLAEMEADEASSRDQAIAQARSLCRGKPEDALLLILGTHLSNKPLIDWVREQHPDASPEEFARLYERYRRRRSRLVAQLRKKVLKDEMSHSENHPALLSQEVER